MDFTERCQLSVVGEVGSHAGVGHDLEHKLLEFRSTAQGEFEDFKEMFRQLSVLEGEPQFL